jgi:hypothetical protein
VQLSATGTYRIEVQVANYVQWQPIVEEVVSLEQPRVLDVEVVEASYISGIVIAGEGALPDNARIGARPERAGPMLMSPAEEALVMSKPYPLSENGEFRVGGLHPSYTYDVGCYLVGQMAVPAARVRYVSVGTSGLRLELSKVAIKGATVIVEAADSFGVALDAFTVQCWPLFESSVLPDTGRESDEVIGGRCTIEGLAIGWYVIRIEGKGYLSAILGPLEVSKLVETLSCTMEVPGEAVIRVVDETNEPIANVGVIGVSVAYHMDLPGQGEAGGCVEGVTDEKGCFRFVPESVGEYHVEAVLGATPLAATTCIIAPSEEAVIRVGGALVASEGELDVRIVDDRGDSVEGVTVIVQEVECDRAEDIAIIASRTAGQEGVVFSLPAGIARIGGSGKGMMVEEKVVVIQSGVRSQLQLVVHEYWR